MPVPNAAWFAAHKTVVIAAGGGAVGLYAIVKKRSSAAAAPTSTLLGSADGTSATSPSGFGFDSSSTDTYNSLEAQIAALAAQMSGVNASTPATVVGPARTIEPETPGVTHQATPFTPGAIVPKTATTAAAVAPGITESQLDAAVGLFTTWLGHGANAATISAQAPGVLAGQKWATPQFAQQEVNIGLLTSGLGNKPTQAQITAQAIADAGGAPAYAKLGALQQQQFGELGNIQEFQKLNPTAAKR